MEGEKWSHWENKLFSEGEKRLFQRFFGKVGCDDTPAFGLGLVLGRQRSFLVDVANDYNELFDC